MTTDPMPSPARGPDARETEVERNLEMVRDRIARACAGAGRSDREVTIVAITKTRPASDVRLLARLGIRDVGENRDQEAGPKAAECADLGLTWHFVGQLQRNKAGSVAHYADIVESVDRASLVAALDRAAGGAGRVLGACIQVDLDDRPPGAGQTGGRGGAAPEDVPELADAVAAAPNLTLLGVMAVAPLGVDPRGPFGRLAWVHERLLADHPGATMRSAGMSADLEAAIAAGATHVRLGSALLGQREALK
jgi:pyridoxal phosphate enzyme (YggS family)